MIPPVVDVAWLAAHPDAVPADVRWYLDGRSGREAYEAGHLPGAVFVDLDRDLAGPPDPQAGRHPLPEPEFFATTMARLGIGDRDTVVGYDDAGGVVAARLVWMLRVTGHDAAVLDGGIGAWPGELSTAPAHRAPAVFAARAWPADRLAGIDDVAMPGVVTLDVRAGERYRGETEPVDPVAGHIPGARNLPARETLDADGRLADDATLRGLFAAAGVRDGAAVVAYCGSGVNACHPLLLLERLGLPPGRLYAGSWSAYSHSGRPVAIGAE